MNCGSWKENGKSNERRLRECVILQECPKETKIVKNITEKNENILKSMGRNANNERYQKRIAGG